jgi:hypothetical protein
VHLQQTEIAAAAEPLYAALMNASRQLLPALITTVH